MNKLVSKILISVLMVAIFLAPVSAGIKINEVKAQDVSSVVQTGVALGTAAATAIATENSKYFDCSAIPWSDLTCKLAGLLYYAVFTPMAVFTQLAAKILDFFVYYSTNSSSYSGDFVAKSWAAVRDVANILFIITLLFIAIKTILGLNVTNNKKLISAVIMVALVINFSLFVTRVVIDSSNVLAKVFYNNITSVGEDGRPLPPDGSGQKSISVGLIKQFNPQEIFGKNFVGHEGLFIFVTILSILLMAFMIYIFLSVALLFVARVVSLWLSMISSPVAFISFATPFKIPGFGFDDWKDNLFKNALLAPIFIFFLYIIILFGDALKNVPYDISLTTNDVGGYLDASMKTIIPFIFIFFLLQQAKDLAVESSGKMGKLIQGAAGAAGGLALGGVAMGSAAIGRQLIGGVMKEASRGDATKKIEGVTKAEDKFQKADIKYKGIHGEHDEAERKYKAAEAEHASASLNLMGNFTDEQKDAAKKKMEAAQKELDAKTKEKETLEAKKTVAEKELSVAKEEKEKMGAFAKAFGTFGSKLNEDQTHTEHSAHARHELDEETGKRYHGKKFKDLTGVEQEEIKKRISRDKEAEQEFGKKFSALKQTEKDAVDKIIEDNKIQGKKDKGDETVEAAKHKQGFISSVAQASRTGSYDIRNLSKLTAKEGTTGYVKFATGTLGALTGAIRGGLKSTLNVNYGEGQKDFIKDLGHTVTEALKGAKLNVNLTNVGKVAAEAHHGGGHDDHGGGHGDAHGGEHH